ncbi:ROK family protein [soil metagenome]
MKEQMTDLAIAVDLGGTNVRCSVIDASGRRLFDSSQSSAGNEGVDAVIQRIARMVSAAADDQDLDESVAVGVAAPGPLDPVKGVVRYAPNLPGWDEVPLRDRLESLTGRKVAVGNDANSQALGEYYFGAAKHVENLVYVALGTGLGGGVIAEGSLIDGVAGLGGELGHTTINMSGPRCSCGSQGCVEAYCSGWAIARDGQALADSGRSAALEAMSADREIDARAVSDAAEAGDSEAAEIIRAAGVAFGAALANFVNIFNPQMIVIGGGLAQIGDLLIEPARRSMMQYALTDLTEELEFRRSALGEHTGLFGAASLVLHTPAD